MKRAVLVLMLCASLCAGQRAEDGRVGKANLPQQKLSAPTT